MPTIVLKMRQALLYALLCLGCTALFGNAAFAQAVKKPVLVYLSAGGGAGSLTHGFIEMHTVFLKHHGISLGYNTYLQDARSTPADFEAGDLLGPGKTPKNFLDGFTITYSYLLYPKQEDAAKMLRFPLSIGALIGTYSEPGNFHRTSTWFGPNYDYDDITEPGFALIMRGGLEFTPVRGFGLRAGAFAVLGNRAGIGVYGGVMLGHVGSRKRIRNRANHEQS